MTAAVSYRFARVASGLARTIAAVSDDAWEQPSPCVGWTARDVVAHLVEWLPEPGFLLGAFGIETRPIPPVTDDPAGAWDAVRDAIQNALDDPAVAGRVEDCGPPGRMSFVAAVEMTCIPDVLIHTWDLAQGAGIEVDLDRDEIDRQVAGLAALAPEVDAAMRVSGHYGPRIDVPAEADALTRLLAFNGRRTSNSPNPK
jgi:uncharacterized protein (TIGR03086 family)